MKARQRETTDESLRSERESTDRKLEEKREAIQEGSDAVLAAARERADAVLGEARAKADSQGAGATPAIQAERAEEDRALAEERATDAAQLGQEREERRRALAELLRFEREETDRDLRIERRGVDAALLTRDEFLGMVSHDLRNLLGNIALSTSLLIREAALEDGPARVVARAESVQRFTARMNRLVGDLLDVVSLESGRFSIVPTHRDILPLVQEAVATFQPAASTRGIALSAVTDPGPLLASFDYERLLQVLANLLGNALKATPAGGRIELQAGREGESIHLSVSDTGSGIPSDQLETIFERFHQVNPADRRGHGLGLYISRCIIEAHGGRIRAESRPGQGSSVHITLPC